MRFETCLERPIDNISTMVSYRDLVYLDAQLMENMFQYRPWIVVDIDNFLNGNEFHSQS